MTITYEASPCVEGQFLTAAIDISSPPVVDDSTRFRDDGPGNGLLIPIVANIGAILTTNNQPGTCCVGNICTSDTISEACCAQTFGGDFHAGKSCEDSDPCVGPCCLTNDSCSMVTADACRAVGGTPRSSGSCSAKVACCLASGTCEFIDPLCCMAMNGVPQPAGSQCGVATSCCSEVGICSSNVDPICCGSTGGTPNSPGTICHLPEACCLSQTDCTMLDPQCCQLQGGMPRGPGSTCSSTICCDSTLADAPPAFIFWTDNALRDVLRLHLNALPPAIIDSTDFFGPSAIVADLRTRLVYWISKTGNGLADHGIFRSNFDGSAKQQIFSGLGSSFGLALNTDEGKIYWTHRTGEIRRGNLDGSGLQTILSGLGHVNDLAIDRVAGKMYWTESIPQGSNIDRIARANLDGSSVETIVPSQDVHEPTGIAVHPGIGKLYWSEGAATDPVTIRRSNIDGTNIQTIVGPLSKPVWDVTVDIASGKIYWTGAGIHRANLDGTNIEELVPDQPFPYGIAVPEGELLIDCQPNGFQDACELINGTTGDCNTNNLPDACDIADGTSQDADSDGIPDECCGDGLCTSFERCLCVEDCGLMPTQEYTVWCSDGIDNDCDGLTDCEDSDCAGPCVQIPTTSTWGLIVLGLSLLVAAKLRFNRYPLAVGSNRA